MELLQLFEWADTHGCLTGDCPHSTANECLAELIKHCQEIARRGRQLGAHLRPCLEAQDEGLEEVAQLHLKNVSKVVKGQEVPAPGRPICGHCYPNICDC